MAHVLLNRLLKHLEQGHLLESQCRFRTGRGTTDMLFAARQIQKVVSHRRFFVLEAFA